MKHRQRMVADIWHVQFVPKVPNQLDGDETMAHSVTRPRIGHRDRMGMCIDRVLGMATTAFVVQCELL